MRGRVNASSLLYMYSYGADMLWEEAARDHFMRYALCLGITALP